MRVAIAAVVACAGPPPAAPVAAPVAAAPTAEAAPPPAPIDISFVPSGVAARLYNVPGGDTAADSALGAALIETIVSGAKKVSRPPPTPDGRLHAAARDLAGVLPPTNDLPYAAVEFALQHYGVIEPTPAMMAIRSENGGETEVAPDIASRLEVLVQSGRFGRVGVGTSTGAGGAVTVVLLLKSSIEMTPLPRTVQQDDAIELRARVLPPYARPELFVTLPDGEVRKSKLEPGKDGRVNARIRCDGAPGRRQIELLAHDELGPSVLANFPVWCGSAPPVELRMTIESFQATSAGAEAAERRLFDLVNNERLRAGLTPLFYDERVAGVARAHSAEMVRTGVVAHTLPGSGTAADRVKAAGIATPLVQENLSRTSGPHEAHLSLMNSPSHRANILSRDATHMGAGVAFGTNGDLIVTQLFIRIAPRVDPDAVRAELEQRLKQAARRLERHGLLAELARQRAEELASGADPSGVAARVADALAETDLSFASVRTLVSAVARVSDFDPRPIAGDRKLTHFGVGVAQGEHKRLGPNTLYVVVVAAGS